MTSEYLMQAGAQKQVEKPKVTFPTITKKVENASIGPDGKHRPKKPVDSKQPTLWKTPN